MNIFTWLRGLFSPSSFKGTVHNDVEEGEATSAYGTSLPDVMVEAAGPGIVVGYNFAKDRTPEENIAIGVIKGSADTAKALGFALFSDHFEEREVACRDKDRTMPTGPELENAKKAAQMMEAIRSYLGDRAITVNSWYRTPEYNRQVGGAKNSYHVKGMAVDFTVAGLTPAQVQRKLIAARDSGKLDIGGIGKYKRWTHCDIGPKRTWQG